MRRGIEPFPPTALATSAARDAVPLADVGEVPGFAAN
jgi:hypothetical protein